MIEPVKDTSKNDSSYLELFTDFLLGRKRARPSRVDSFHTRTDLCERYDFHRSSEEVGSALVGLFVRSVKSTGSRPACLDDIEETADEVSKMIGQPAESALPEPRQRHEVSKDILTDPALFAERMKSASHAVITYPKQGYENLTTERVESELHTLYFGHVRADPGKCMFFDPDVEGGGSVKAPCEPLIRYVTAHIASRYSQTDKRPAAVTIADEEENASILFMKK